MKHLRLLEYIDLLQICQIIWHQRFSESKQTLCLYLYNSTGKPENHFNIQGEIPTPHVIALEEGYLVS